MTTTAQRLAVDGGVELFYYLKVSGLPYYFGAVIDPTVATSGAWTLPSGYTWVRGMDLPNDSLQQRIGDIVGGIAEPERIRVTLKDFQAFDASGPYQYLARLFAPGRFALTGTVAELETTIKNTDGAAATFRVRGCNAAIGTSGVVHVNGEAIGISAISGPGGDGRETLTIAARNKFPCATGYPPTPTHRTVRVDDILVSSLGGQIPGVAGRNQFVTDDPVTLIGRTAALYICAINQHGAPLPETDAMCRLIGRITSMDTEDATDYELQIESIAADLDSAPLASGLAKATIKPGQINLVPAFRTMTAIFTSTATAAHPTEDEGTVLLYRTMFIDLDWAGFVTTRTYDAENLLKFVNTAIHASYWAGTFKPSWVPQAQLVTVDGVRHFMLANTSEAPTNTSTLASTKTAHWRFINGSPDGGSHLFGGARVGLLTAMGFTDDQQVTWDETGGEQGVTAQQPAASVMIPVSNFGGGEEALFEVIGGNAETADASAQSGGFLTSPFNPLTVTGSAVAYVRFGNGMIARMLDVTSGGASEPVFLHTHRRPNYEVLSTGFDPFSQAIYYVPEGAEATVEQVVVMPGEGAVDVGLGIGGMLGRVLASGNPTSSSTLNIYNGIGLGWADILDTTAIRTLEPAAVPRVAIIDSRTKFSDLFMAVSKEYGWFLVWDPEQGKFSIRKVGVPAESVAHAVSFTDSNRVREGDRTAQHIDRAHIRGSWTLRWGYDALGGKFRAPDFTILDSWAMSAFGGVAKSEVIEDKTITTQNGVTALSVLTEVLRRAYFYRQPWLRCRRSINKAGLLLAPGTFHQVVDATLVNPFTGRVGVASTDKVYCLLVGVTANPATGVCEVEYLINRQDPSSLFRMWSPTALVDFAATSHGYNSGTGVLTLKQRWSNDGTTKDGIDFVVGDLVYLVSRDNDATLGYVQGTTVTAVASDGSTMTVGTGLTALPSTSEVMVVLQEYDAPQTATRKLQVAFQGQENGLIATGVPNNRWI